MVCQCMWSECIILADAGHGFLDRNNFTWNTRETNIPPSWQLFHYWKPESRQQRSGDEESPFSIGIPLILKLVGTRHFQLKWQTFEIALYRILQTKVRNMLSLWVLRDHWKCRPVAISLPKKAYSPISQKLLLAAKHVWSFSFLKVEPISSDLPTSSGELNSMTSLWYCCLEPWD